MTQRVDEHFTRAHILQWLETCHVLLDANKNYLTALDAAIGDADHGINMARGFNKVMDKLPGVAGADIGAILRTTGMTLLASVGGASGPFYGTFFLRAAEAVAARHTLAPEDLLRMLEHGVEGIAQRGRAEVGEKTMIDAWVPAVATLRQAIETGDTLTSALEQSVAAAKAGAEATIPLIARKGRASYLGERSAGHQDPGATSTYLILSALLDVYR